MHLGLQGLQGPLLRWPPSISLAPVSLVKLCNLLSRLPPQQSNIIILLQLRFISRDRFRPVRWVTSEVRNIGGCNTCHQNSGPSFMGRTRSPVGCRGPELCVVGPGQPSCVGRAQPCAAVQWFHRDPCVVIYKKLSSSINPVFWFSNSLSTKSTGLA